MKECIYRAFRTFIQAAAGYLAANLVVVISSTDASDFDALKMALVGLASSAVAAGLAALMNMKKCPSVSEGENDDNSDA